MTSTSGAVIVSGAISGKGEIMLYVRAHHTPSLDEFLRCSASVLRNLAAQRSDIDASAVIPLLVWELSKVCALSDIRVGAGSTIAIVTVHVNCVTRDVIVELPYDPADNTRSFSSFEAYANATLPNVPA